MATVGVRELKNHLSEYLKRASEGERVLVTDRGRPFAVISAPGDTGLDPHIRSLLQQGLMRWGGGKPRGSSHPVKLRKGPTMAETVIEGRR